MRTQKGFSLIELVVAMLIAATLAAIAIPSYSNYTRKAHRADAKNALLDIASLEERYFSTQNIYSSSWADLGYGASSASTIAIGNGYYNVATPALASATAPTASTTGTPATYSVTATAVGDQLKDTNCATFTVTSGGARSAQNAASADTTASCW